MEEGLTMLTEYDYSANTARVFLDQSRMARMRGDTPWATKLLRWAGNQRRKALGQLKPKEDQMSLF